MPFLTPLQRIRKTLADSDLPRGVNGTPIEITLTEEDGTPAIDHQGEPIVKKAVRNPLIGLIGQDVVAVCNGILEREPENQKIKDLHMGSRRAVAGRGDPVEVFIHVDDAWHIAKLGKEPAPEVEESEIRDQRPEVREETE